MKTDNEVLHVTPEDRILIESFMGDGFTLSKDRNGLMSVVERIELLWTQYPIQDITNDRDQFYFLEVFGKSVSSKIEVVYKAVVKFIKWYNQQSK